MQAHARLQGIPGAENAQKKEGGKQNPQALCIGQVQEFFPQKTGEGDEYQEGAGEHGTAAGEHCPQNDACRE